MVAVVLLVLLALPVIGAVVGYGLFAVSGAWIGGLIGIGVAALVVALPFRMLVNTERAKAAAPRPPRPDVPWA